MKRGHLSIASLLGVVAILGVGLAALRSPTQLWAGLALCLTLGSLTMAPLAAVYRRGTDRAFWVGFATCGWAYLVVHLAPWFDSHVGPHLATTAALDFAYDRLQPPEPRGMPYPIYAYMPEAGTKSMTSRFAFSKAWLDPEWKVQPYFQMDRTMVLSTVRYRRIGHSLLALLAAYGGGTLTRRMAAAPGGVQEHPR
jgi:hypothetical protein